MADIDGIRAFLEAMVQQNKGLQGFFTLIAARLGIPYSHDRENERVIQTRHEGEWVPGEHGGKVWDSGKDYSHDNYPDSFNGVPDALEKIRRPVAMWYHTPSMNLVILDDSGVKVGIRSTALRIPLIGMHPGNINALVEGLQAKLKVN